MSYVWIIAVTHTTPRRKNEGKEFSKVAWISCILPGQADWKSETDTTTEFMALVY